MHRFFYFWLLVMLTMASIPKAFGQSATGIGLRLLQADLIQPVSMIKADNEHYYFAELAGRIRVRTPDGVLLEQPAIDMSLSSFQCSWLGQMQSLPVVSGGEKGLLNIAADEGFSVHRRIYALYTTATRIVLVRLLASAGFTVLQPASCEVVLMTEASVSNHLGGGLAFGPDGLLYIGLGEQFSHCPRVVAPSDPRSSGCQSSTGLPALHPLSRILWGKILRINPNGITAAGHSLCGLPSANVASYSAPDGNAFGAADRCQEVLAYGLRNPWRVSVDWQSNDVLVGDVGNSGAEELNVAVAAAAGTDFGWPCLHGLSALSGSGSGCVGVTINNTTTASLLFNAEESRAIVGGVRLRRGDRFNGHYLGADISQKIHFSPGGSTAGFNQLRPLWPKTVLSSIDLLRPVQLSFPVSINDDRRGNFYLVDLSGSVYQFLFDDTIIFRNHFE
jgi:glucose/arabinose dehydrogenase